MTLHARPVGHSFAMNIVHGNYANKEPIQRYVARTHSYYAKTGFTERLTRFLSFDKYMFIMLAAVAAATLIAFTDIVKVLAVLVLLVLASYSTVYKRKLGIPLGGVELVTFGTIITAVVYGPWAGLVFGLISAAASETLSANLGPLTWMYILGMGVIGIFAGNLAGMNIIFLGLAATVAMLLLNNVWYLVIGDAEIKGFTLLYLGSNLIFNFLIFTTLATRVLSIMTY